MPAGSGKRVIEANLYLSNKPNGPEKLANDLFNEVSKMVTSDDELKNVAVLSRLKNDQKATDRKSTYKPSP